MSDQSAKVVFYDGDEAAKQATVTGWVSRDGRYFGKDEHSARWNGCTVLRCACGAFHEKGWTVCQTCRDKAADEQYNSLPFVGWDGITPLCLFRDDKYFFSEHYVFEYCEENSVSVADMQLVVCEPQYAHQIIPDDEYSDILPEDCSLADMAPELAAAFDTLNAAILAYGKPLSWYGGKKRTTVKERVEP